MDEIEQARAEGYNTGYEWPDAWDSHAKPGGPWIQRGNATSEAANVAWREGWARGHAQKLVEGKSNPMRTRS